MNGQQKGASQSSRTKAFVLQGKGETAGLMSRGRPSPAPESPLPISPLAAPHPGPRLPN